MRSALHRQPIACDGGEPREGAQPLGTNEQESLTLTPTVLMFDRMTPADRSAHMGKIRRMNTKPERIVRSLLHGLGYRFRLQWKAAPGRPDIAFPGRRKIIFIHGCFWHQHEGCKFAHVPRTRETFWAEKFRRNKERDSRLEKLAAEKGWDILVVWECEMAARDALVTRLRKFLGPTRHGRS